MSMPNPRSQAPKPTTRGIEVHRFLCGALAASCRLLRVCGVCVWSRQKTAASMQTFWLAAKMLMPLFPTIRFCPETRRLSSSGFCCCCCCCFVCVVFCYRITHQSIKRNHSRERINAVRRRAIDEARPGMMQKFKAY